MASIKVKITSDRNKRKVFHTGLAKDLGRKLTIALAASKDLRSSLRAGIAKTYPKLKDLEAKPGDAVDEFLLVLSTIPKDAFQQKLEELAEDWLGNPGNPEFAEAVLARLEGKEKPEAGEYLHRAVAKYLRGTRSGLKYGALKREIIRRKLGDRLSIK